MTLAKRLTQPDSSYPRTPCSVGVLLKELPKREAKALRELLDAPWRVWPHTEVEAAIRGEGHHVGYQQVGKHRRGQCSCTRAAA